MWRSEAGAYSTLVASVSLSQKPARALFCSWGLDPRHDSHAAPADREIGFRRCRSPVDHKALGRTALPPCSAGVLPRDSQLAPARQKVP
jgi:hypothetical protein